MSHDNWQGIITSMLIVAITATVLSLIINLPSCTPVDQCLKNNSPYCQQIIQNQYPIDRKE